MSNEERNNMNAEMPEVKQDSVVQEKTEVQHEIIKWDKKTFTTYIVLSFSVAWVFQVIASILGLRGNQMAFTVILSVSMFVPLLSALVAGVPLKNIGWKPVLKGNIKQILMAWFGPFVLTVLGAALYYIIFPNRLDLTGAFLKASYGEIALTQMEAQGITIPALIIISVIQTVTYAPWINMFVALGEEAGWRGVMHPMLKDKLGNTKGVIVSGIIWGAWHWPVMVIAGYEYGLEYWGAPALGMVLFCLVTVVMGTLFDVLYEKTKCIWVPSLAHGAVNAVCSLPMLVLDPAYGNQLTVGPLPIGIISVMPALILTVWILIKKNK